MKIKRHVAALAGLIVGILALAPATNAASSSNNKIVQEADQFATDKPDALRPLYKALYVEGEHNAVLNFDYLGQAAMEVGDYATAERAFDASIERIEAIYADNPNAKKAKSLFSAEKVKDFKGEPYERAMTYYYRGLLYLRTGDYQNARASFLSAERQSTLGEAEAYDSTFGLMDYLAGWSSFCDGDVARAAELKDRAAKAQPDLFQPLPPNVNYISLIDVGTGPSKYGAGEHKEKLSFKPGDASPQVSSVSATAVSLDQPIVAGDLNFQATTRGGRQVDAILNGKAQWKTGTEAVSGALTTAGMLTSLQGAASGNQNMQNAGTIGMFAGLIGGLVAGAMTPAADTRAWSTLPAAVALSTGRLEGESVPNASFVVAPDGTTKPAALNARAGTCGFAWGRTNSALPVAVAQVSSPAPAESKREAANAQFRSFLTQTFPAAQSSAPASR